MTEQEALRLSKKYPWYKPAAIFLDNIKSREDSSLGIHYMFYPGPKAQSVTEDDFIKYEKSFIINDFLARDNVHIVPADQIPQGDLSVSKPHDDELVTEELAEIYLSQGHNDTAMEIYGKLSLLYPEKSVYFAKIIETVNKPENE